MNTHNNMVQKHIKSWQKKIFKNTQGVNSGRPKDAETLEREHKRWQAEQKKAK